MMCGRDVRHGARVRYAKSGTDLGSGAILVRYWSGGMAYAMCGTELAYDTESPVLSQGMELSTCGPELGYGAVRTPLHCITGLCDAMLREPAHKPNTAKNLSIIK
eukprot:382405-Rhodomonas_salina.3